MRICVFCGSSAGRSLAYGEAAAAFGALLAREGIGLVYGGGRVGLMGAVAEAAQAAGGEVIGVIPEALATREVAHFGLQDLRGVGSMHERTALMSDLSDAFVALPGGIGTFEELFEMWTWAQLGLHPKPVALLDVQGFYGGLTQFLDHVAEEGFLRAPHRALLLVERDPIALLARLRSHRPVTLPKLIDRSDT